MNVQLLAECDRHLYRGDRLAGVVFGAFWSEKWNHWSGAYRAPAAPPADDAERVVRAAIVDMQEWHFQQKGGLNPDPRELEVLQHQAGDGEWALVDTMGAARTLLTPRFERWGLFWQIGEALTGRSFAGGETWEITLTAYQDRPIPGSKPFTYEDLELRYGTAEIGVLLNSFESDDTWYGLFRQPAARWAGVEAERVREFIQFSREWHVRAEEGDPDAGEFDRFADLLDSAHWNVVDRKGVTRAIQAPVFYAGEASWRAR